MIGMAMNQKDLLIIIAALLATSFNVLITTLIFFWIAASFLHKDNISKIKAKDWKSIAVLAVFATGLAMNFYYIGLNFTTAINTAFIVRLQTPFMILFAYFMIKERITRNQAIAMLLMFIGAYLLIVKQLAFTFNIGDAFILGSAFLWGYTNIYYKKALPHLPTELVLFGRFLLGTAIVVVITFALFGFSLFNAFYIVPHFVIATALTYSIYIFGLFYGIKEIGANFTGIIMLLAPLIATILAFFFLGEQFIPIQYLGAALILIGSYFLIKRK